MKGVFLWALGGTTAFLATAGAFLLLASLGSSSETSTPIPPAERAGAGSSSSPALVLDLPEERLVGLGRAPGQRLALDIVNRGNEDLAGIEIELEVVPADTTRPRQHNYREVLETLAPGEATTVEFELDLSPSLPTETRPPGADLRAREILQLNASAPGVAPAVKTAVLAP
ncbi:hypothetical protein BH24ACT19_BH24ACT19_05520 [soil metagenome]